MSQTEDPVARVMPGIIADLERLVAIPSCAFPGFPREPVLRMAEATVDLLKRSGLPNARAIAVEDGYPVVYGEVHGPKGAPTVLLYAHYDVQPAPAEQAWTVDPWTPEVRNGRLYGRGAADDKSGIAMHAATLQVLGAAAPVNLKIVVEGEEETDSHLDSFVRQHPDLFEADVFVIADSGNDVIGHPLLCTALRGAVGCTIEVRTLEQPVHSGLFGGVAPDALLALVRILATLHDDEGNTTIPGLSSGDWQGSELDEELVRRMAGVRTGVELVGSGSVNSRLVARPSATVIGLSAPPLKDAVNALVPTASAALSIRIPPEADAEAELEVVVRHLNAVVPWNAELRVFDKWSADGFNTTTGPVLAAAKAAMSAVYGMPAEESGSGGSIPLLNTLQHFNPKSEFIIWGAEDAEHANIHSADESVSLRELEQAIRAQVRFLTSLGTRNR